MMDILDVPHFEQSGEGYCLPACRATLAWRWMVLAYLGIERTEAEIAKLLGTGQFGTPNFAIQRLVAWGLQVDFRIWLPSALLPALAAKQPVIIFVQTGFLDYYSLEENFSHAIVVVGAQEQQFWVNDPNQSEGPLLVSLDGLFAAWAEFKYRAAVLQVMPQKPSRLSRIWRWFFQR